MKCYVNLIVMEIVQQMKWHAAEMVCVKTRVSLVISMVNVTVIQVGLVPSVANIAHINVIGNVQITNMHALVMVIVLDTTIVLVSLDGLETNVKMIVDINALECAMEKVLLVLVMEHVQVQMFVFVNLGG